MGKTVDMPNLALDAKLEETFPLGPTGPYQQAPPISVGTLEMTVIPPHYPASLAEALAMVQAEIPEVLKAETAKIEKEGKKGYTYNFADLSAVTRVILPRLGKVGLSFITKPTLIEGRLYLVYKLLHVSGETEEGVYPLPSSGGPQEIGGAITYARRYVLCSITGVAPGDDDDAAEAQAAHKRGQQAPQQSEMSKFERDTGLVMLYPPSAEQRTTAGPVVMLAAFQQALDFAICIGEHSAWDGTPVAGGDTWGSLLQARILDEVAHADTGEQVNAIWTKLKAAVLLTEEVALVIKERAAALKERNAKAYDTITGQVLNATLEDIADSTGPVGVSITEAFVQGRITDEQRKELITLVGERIAKLQREQNQKAAE